MNENGEWKSRDLAFRQFFNDFPCFIRGGGIRVGDYEILHIPAGTKVLEARKIIFCKMQAMFLKSDEKCGAHATHGIGRRRKTPATRNLKSRPAARACC